MDARLKRIVVPLVAVLAGFVLGALIMLAIGTNPIFGYEDMFSGALGNMKAIGNTIQTMGPLMLTALAFAVTMKAGLFNIGMAGQALAGWVASFIFALSFPQLPAVIMFPAMIVIAMAAGALMGVIPGVLRALLGTSEVITTIMLNYVIMYTANWILASLPKSMLNPTSAQQTNQIPGSANFQVSWLTGITQNSTLNISIFLAILAVVVMSILMRRTTLGFEINAVGLNPNASDYAGISAKRIIIVSMIISGILAGLGGLAYGEGLSGAPNFFQQASTLDVGFNGMVVALLAENNPVGILFSSFLFAILQTGAPAMSFDNIPTQVAQIVAAAIIFFVAIKFVIETLLPKAREAKEKAIASEQKEVL
ncbi:MAG: ABC transporter permease [Streptococcaceae bacterium]|jgi:simple sugar transport system permease protein|nr:ABC transporter permease [Streptococcaceae bacterium]